MRTEETVHVHAKGVGFRAAWGLGRLGWRGQAGSQGARKAKSLDAGGERRGGCVWMCVWVLLGGIPEHQQHEQAQRHDACYIHRAAGEREGSEQRAARPVRTRDVAVELHIRQVMRVARSGASQAPGTEEAAVETRTRRSSWHAPPRG